MVENTKERSLADEMFKESLSELLEHAESEIPKYNALSQNKTVDSSGELYRQMVSIEQLYSPLSAALTNQTISLPDDTKNRIKAVTQFLNTHSQVIENPEDLKENLQQPYHDLFTDSSSTTKSATSPSGSNAASTSNLSPNTSTSSSSSARLYGVTEEEMETAKESEKDLASVERQLSDIKNKLKFVPKILLKTPYVQQRISAQYPLAAEFMEQSIFSGRTKCIDRNAKLIDVLSKELTKSFLQGVIFPGKTYSDHAGRVHFPTDKIDRPLAQSRKATKKDEEETRVAREQLTADNFRATIKSKSEEIPDKDSIISRLPQLFLNFMLSKSAQEESIKRRSKLAEREQEVKTNTLDPAAVKVAIKNDYTTVLTALTDVLKHLDQIMVQLLLHPTINRQKVFDTLTRRLEKFRDAGIFQELVAHERFAKVLSSLYTTYVDLAAKLPIKEKDTRHDKLSGYQERESISFLAFAHMQLATLKGNKEVKSPGAPSLRPDSLFLDLSSSSRPASPLSTSLPSFSSSDETPNSPSVLDNSGIISPFNSSASSSSSMVSSSSEGFRIPVGQTFLAPPTPMRIRLPVNVSGSLLTVNQTSSGSPGMGFGDNSET